MHLHLSVDLPEDKAHLPILRRMTRDALKLCEVQSLDIDDIELLIGELASNAVLHSRSGTYNVDIDISDDRAVVTVADSGAGFERGAILPPGTLRPIADDELGERIGGMGLPLVEMVADEVSYRKREPHGTIARAAKVLRRVPVAT